MLNYAKDSLRPKVGELVTTDPDRCYGCSAETPWAICREIHDDGTMDAEINNHLGLTEEHSIECGDVVRFEHDGDWWVPVMQEVTIQ